MFAYTQNVCVYVHVFGCYQVTSDRNSDQHPGCPVEDIWGRSLWGSTTSVQYSWKGPIDIHLIDLSKPNFNYTSLSLHVS